MCFKYLAIQSNQIDVACMEHILHLLKRRLPNQLEELHLIYAKCQWQATHALVQRMKGGNSLRKLSLVDAGLNELSMNELSEVIKT